MKTQKLILEIDEDDEITIGLIRLAKEVPDHELFYHINNLNPFQFKRISDLKLQGYYSDYFFPRYEAFHNDSQICIHIIANQSSESVQKKKSTELFTGEENLRYLLDDQNDVEYLIKTSEPFGDFSVILLPENLMFQIQDFQLSPHEALYQLIQYYE